MDAQGFLPLQPAALHILLALAQGDRHGYGIMQEVARQSGCGYKIGPGTLYDNLQRLLKQGVVSEVEGESRRRYYRLTELGRSILSAELNRLEAMIRQGRLHIGLDAGRA